MDADKLAAVEWDTLILDEAQAIKNPDSQVAQAAFQQRARFRVTMTGTPVENRLEELWSQAHFTNPGVLGGRATFVERYAKPIELGRNVFGIETKMRDRDPGVREFAQNIGNALA